MIMKLRDRSEELEHLILPGVKLEGQPLESGSNISDQTADGGLGGLDPSPSVKTGVLPETALEGAPETPQVAKKVPTTKKKTGRRKRKSAEEKAANVRARNRRAQQAFRKRQKALSQEKNESMANLMEEVDELRETNRVLQNTVDKLLQQLDGQEMLHIEQRNASLLANGTMPMLTGQPFMMDRQMTNNAQNLMEPALPDLLADNSVPDLLQDLDFGHFQHAF